MRTRFILTLLACAAVLAGQPKKVLLYQQLDEGPAELQAASDKVEIVLVDDSNVLEEIADAHGFIGNITPEMVRAGKQLEWVQTFSAGVEQVLHRSGGTDLRDSDIVLTNNQIVQGPEIADHAMALLLTLSRDIPRYLRLKEREEWQRRPIHAIELNTKRAVVIGVGGIGTQIAVRAWAHGMRVVGVDPEDIPYLPFIEKVVKPDQLDDVLPLADVIFMAAPHTEKSHKMLGPSQFDLMKQDSYFIAVSRGRTYDMDALVKALDSGKLAGAGVDVTDPEPLPEGHPLWKFDNAVITPHVAGRSDLDRGRMLGMVKENLRRFGEGLPLINVVNKQKGY